MKLRSLLSALFVGLLLVSTPAFAQDVTHQYGLWSENIIHGHFNKTKWQYRGELHIRFASDDPVFDQTIARFGLGYGLNPDVTIWMGYDLVHSDQFFIGQVQFEQRVWQQLWLHLINSPHFTLDTRTRVELRDDLDEKNIAWRLRNMTTMRFPIGDHGKITPYLSDEIFLNLNHPVWVSSDTLSQNRLYVGVAIQVKKSLLVRVAYLNQAFFDGPFRLMRHIVFVSLIINGDNL